MGVQTRARLSPRLIASLDAARAAAAGYVVLHHVADSRGWTHGAGIVFRFGQEAVLVFFLLSGFVIFANERVRAARPAGYLLRRLRRIYPALLVAIGVSTLVALDNGDLAARFSWRELAGTMLCLQDIALLKPGVIVEPYLQNTPLWSLSYEVAFYLAFPPVLALWRRRPRLANHLIGLVCCAAYAAYALAPNHWSLVAAYFLVWWAGAMAADGYLRGGGDVRAVGATFGWLLALCGVAAAVTGVVGYRGPGVYPFLPLRHFLVAAGMLAALYSGLGRRIAAICESLARPAADAASVSYGLYVLHYPLLVVWRRAWTPAGLALALGLVLAAAWLTDRKLNQWLPRAPAT